MVHIDANLKTSKKYFLLSTHVFYFCFCSAETSILSFELSDVPLLLTGTVELLKPELN